MNITIGSKKLEFIQAGAWQNNPCRDGVWLDKLSNPRKYFFLCLATDYVRSINSQPDHNGISYAYKTINVEVWF